MNSVQSRRCAVVSCGRRFALFSFHCLAGLLCLTAVFPAGAAMGADLIIWANSINPRIVYRNYTTANCEVVEGCALPGPRRYLIFNTETRNIGNADIVLGNPANN